MRVASTLDYETEVPAYQREAVEWLKGYRGTQRICELLLKVRFSEAEIATYRGTWAKWLKPKKELREQIRRGIH